MMTLLSTLVSFLAGGLPKLLEYFQSKQDHLHEYEMARLQKERELALAAQGFAAQQKIEEVRTDQIDMQTQASTHAALLNHDIEIGKGASQWIINLRASVRPVVTYIFVADLVLAGVAGFFYAWHTNVPFETMLANIFSDDEMQILASIISFWFGTQAFKK
jgi:hypothetical protein